MATRRRRAQDDADLERALEQSKKDQMSDFLEDSEEEKDSKGKNRGNEIKRSSSYMDDSDGIGDPDFGEDDHSVNNGETNGSQSVRARRENALQRKRKTPSIHDQDEDAAVNPIDKWTKAKPKMDVKLKRKVDLKEEEKSSGNETTIPKKKIPKKSPDIGEGIKSSLIDKLAPVLPTQVPAQTTQSRKAKSTSPIPAPKSPPRPKSSSEAKPDRKLVPPAQVSAVADVNSVTVEHKHASFNGAQQALLNLIEKRVMDSLAQVCDTYRTNQSFKISDSVTPNLSGSFLRKEGDNYDFFDLNEKGEIINPPMLPIFPEEFPAGMKEHSLAWWGIVDPAFGDGRFRAVHDEEAKHQRSTGKVWASGHRANSTDPVPGGWGQQRPNREPIPVTSRQDGAQRLQGVKRTF